MRPVLALLVLIAVRLCIPSNAGAQTIRRVVVWPANLETFATPAFQQAVQIPDSVRQRVGYNHWKGAAIGGGAGAIGGLLLALAAHGSCSDCSSDNPNIAAVSLVGAGLGGAFGFLVGLASPKYEWLPRAAVRDATRWPE